MAILRRPDARSISFWTWAAFAILASGMGTQILGNLPWATVIGYAMGTVYPALLLAGAVVYSGRERPRGLVAAAMLLGAGRGLLVNFGEPVLAHGLALLVEPPAAVAAAVIVYRSNRKGPPAVWPRTLPPALLAIGVLEAVSAGFGAASGILPVSVLACWVVGASLLLALQIAAVSDQSRDEALAQSVSDLRESEERYRILSELSSDYSFAARMGADHSIDFVWASDGLERITGFTTEELRGVGWIAVLPAEDRQDSLAQLDAVISGRTREMEFRIIDRSGGERWLHTIFDTVANQSDGSTLIVGATRDVTERKRFDEHLREVQRLESLGVLAGGIAHDFNNMLTVIRGNARLAMADYESARDPSERLERIHTAAEYATRLTQQMLTYSGRGVVELQSLDLSQLVHDMLDLLRASSSEKSVLDPALCDGLPALHGDVTQIRQVVLNLVTNASEALGDEGGRILVRTELVSVDEHQLADSYGSNDAEPGDYLCLEVSDTGVGIAPEVRARIFEPFFSTKPTGQGLGLAAVLGIVTAHRGVIRIDSAPGRGTSFVVLFPCAGAGATLAPDDTPRGRAPGGRCILVVDDDEAVLDVTREFLERADYSVLTASGGAEAVETLRSHRDEIDGVVLDLVMPGMTGEEAYVEMRRLKPDLPVVLTSGYDKQQAAARFAGRGIAGFLYKPFEPEELLDSVARALRG
jgi:PAS domain S-box-containing protein